MATYRKRKGRISATVRIEPHPSQTQTFDTMRDAKAWVAETEIRLRSESSNEFNHITLDYALTSYRDEKVIEHRGSKNDTDRVNRLMREFDITQPLNKIDRFILAAWRDDRKKDVQAASIIRDMNLLNSFFNWCANTKGWIKTNPLNDVDRPKAPPHRERVISQNEIAVMLDALNHREEKPELVSQEIAIMFLLALETGMRAGEICQLTWDRVHLKQRFLYLDKTKNGRAREVPMSQRAIDLLELMQGVNAGMVFSVDSASLDANFRKARTKAKLSGFTFHDTRHTAATKISQKIHALDLCKMFGWSDPKKALIYYNPTATEIALRL